MENNPNPTPNTTPEPAAPAPAPAPQEQPASAPEPAAEPAPAAPTPEPAPTPAPEQPAAPAPEQQPAPAQEPTPEPAPAPTPEAPSEPIVSQPTPEPAAPAPEQPVVTPDQPIAPQPASTPDQPAPAKKPKGGVIAAIIVGVVLLLGGLGFLAFSMLSKNPTRLANESFINAMSAKTFAYKATVDATSDSQSMSYSAEVTALENGETYVRMNGIAQLFGSMLSSLITNSSAQSKLTEAFNKIDNTWWKLDESSDSTSMIGVNADSLSATNRQKTVAALKANPFLIAEKATGKSFPTSGDVYKISVDQEKLAAYRRTFNGDDDDKDDNLSISGIDFENSDTPIYFTVQSPLFGGAILTGIYAEATSESTSGTVAIDFEHVQRTAPAEFKNISEMSTILQEAYGSNSQNSYTYDDDYDYYDLDYDYYDLDDLD